MSTYTELCISSMTKKQRYQYRYAGTNILLWVLQAHVNLHRQKCLKCLHALLGQVYEMADNNLLSSLVKWIIKSEIRVYMINQNLFVHLNKMYFLQTPFSNAFMSHNLFR